MRVLSPLACLLLALTGAPACGGDDDDDNGGGTGVDAGQGAGADAAPAGGGLGDPCDPDLRGADCPAGTRACIFLEENATVGFCSDACATTANSMTNPPAGSDDACIAINDSDATPACAAPIDDPMTGMTVWVCALACGMTATVDFGTCPSNLTCDQPDTTLNGFCLP